MTYAYNADGQRAAMTDGTGTTTYSYDSLNRLTGSTNGAGATTADAYDLAGNLTTLTYPNGHTVTRTYDSANHLTGVTDWLGHVTHFNYDADANLAGQTYANGVTTSNVFDKVDRVSSITTAGVGGTLAKYRYGRDDNGQVTADHTSGISNDQDQYGYTALNKLAKTDDGRYSYDQADNPTQLADQTTQTFDAANELLSSGIHSGNDRGDSASHLSTAYTYDNQGNRVSSKPKGSPATTLSYDQANRLIRYGANATYRYDGDGLRQSKTVGSTTTAFVWDRSQGLALLLGDGNDYYLYGPAGTPVEKITGTSVLYLHQDQQGNTRFLTNSAGKVAGSYSYDPYGNVTNHTGGGVTTLQYNGQYTDSESKFQYLRARYYDPKTAQFIGSDPAFQWSGARYGYGNNNPLTYGDPGGLSSGGPACGPGCESLASKIQDIVNEIKKRKQDILDDKLNLPADGPMSIAGHQQKFSERQTTLRRFLDEWNTLGCGHGSPAPANAYRWAYEPVPSPLPKNNDSSENAPSPSGQGFRLTPGEVIVGGGVVIVGITILTGGLDLVFGGGAAALAF